MNTTVLNINKTQSFSCQVEATLSFSPFIAHLKNQISKENNFKTEFYTYVLQKFEKAEGSENLEMCLEHAGNHRDMLELIYFILTPPITDEKTFFWALSTPVPDKIFFCTDAFFQFHSDHNSGIYEKEGGSTEQTVRQKQFIYKLLLDRLYGFTWVLPNELLYAYIDTETNLSRYYNIITNTDFVDIQFDGKLPSLTFDKIEPYLYDNKGLELLETILPLSMFRFEGFSVITLTDITLSHAVQSIRDELVNHTADDKQQYRHIIRSLKSLSENPAIEFGLLPFYTINHKLVFNADDSSQSVLMAAAWEFGLAEETFYSLASDYKENARTIIFSSITDEKLSQHPFLKVLEQAGVKSYGLFPVYYNRKLAGVMEVYSYHEIVFYEQLLSRLQSVIPLIAQLLQNSIDQFTARIESVIKNKFTSLQSSVEWKFKQAAWEYLTSKSNQKNKEIDIVSFKHVYPLFGAIDIRNSTIERNRALQMDLKALLSDLIETLSALQKNAPSGNVTALIATSGHWLSKVRDYVSSDDELMLDNFLDNEVGPFLDSVKTAHPEQHDIIKKYFDSLDQQSGSIFKNRRNLETSMQLINTSINHHLEQAQVELQDMYPCYFEKFRTDGVEYDIYIGQSISPEKAFDLGYLKRVRLWQLKAMAEIAKLTTDLALQMPRVLQTTQLIFVYSNPIDITFRSDEKRFDVEGAYNIRYEVIKKRIDKALINNSLERLTQPGKIAIVYFNNQEADEYVTHIKQLQRENLLQNNLEYLDLEELQGVNGLRALRVGIVL